MVASLSFATILIFFLATIAASQSQSFDFFYFVQQWPGSYCDTSDSCCYPSTGKPASRFSIHGLWPNGADGSYPSNCGGSFDPSQISDLESQLQEYWDTLACPSGDGEVFWSHEWTKHGTCSGMDEHSYFQAALSLRLQIDLLAALQAAGIQADGSTHDLTDINAAFTKGIGQTPGLECNSDSSGNSQLYQVYVCVDKDAATVIECPVLPSASCSSQVTFPSF